MADIPEIPLLPLAELQRQMADLTEAVARLCETVEKLSESVQGKESEDLREPPP
jgi:uncharacterized coiled-coil protein SlyX